MLAEFKIINDPLRPSICTNLCSVCYRNTNEGKKIGCCSYEPEFCLFDLVFIYLHYPDIYKLILEKGSIIKGFNGIMIEMKVGLNHCPFASELGCTLPKDALPPVCRLYICREAAVFGPPILDDRFNEYLSSEEYNLNIYLNSKLTLEMGVTNSGLHNFILEYSQTVSTMIAEINRNNPLIETFSKEIVIENFGLIL